ncbi:NUDIX hydrolase [Bifidobacterium boum]|uniref:NUDIX hydrolase n=1 Tax=Bifidobacterium boum TaxID=78343 RepID=A0A848CW14_9BIFI|nr:NUDIX hydrolase [Bifidobacterium boum]NMF01835.1 NUDIX hydrolase [Bifidobacterium boum]
MTSVNDTPVLPIDDTEPPLITQQEHIVFHDPTSADYTVFECQATVRDTGKTFRMHTTQVSGGRTGAVCIARLDPTGIDEHVEARYLIARHWRISTHAWGWEFPRGMGEEHESAEETARRELKEETGIDVPVERVNVVQRIHADTGVLRDSIAVAEITVADADIDAARPAINHTGDTDWELRNAHWVDTNTLRAMIANGEITDGITLACWAIHECRESAVQYK